MSLTQQARLLAARRLPALRYTQPAACLSSAAPPASRYDVVVVGGGHNGLVAAAYLGKAGLSVGVLERRPLLGGAAVTEEIVPGFKFSRASYLVSLLRPEVVRELDLKRHGLRVILRDPNSFTPLDTPVHGAWSLTLGRDAAQNARQIAQFSARDAERYHDYETQLDRFVAALQPLLTVSPVHLASWSSGSVTRMRRNWPSLRSLLRAGRALGRDTGDFYDLLTAPAQKILSRWFESEPLKATLATDAVIGAMTSPELPGSGYVLLHHVMGELEGVKGAWGYAQGGMGAVSDAIAAAAREAGATLHTDVPVASILTKDGAVSGVVTEGGLEIEAKVVLSNATPHVTFTQLMTPGDLDKDFLTAVQNIDYTSPVTKVNLAVDRLPAFTAVKDTPGQPGPHHQTTIHLNCEHSGLLHQAYLDAQAGRWSARPVIEMTIPSAVDPGLAPPGGHVVQLFTQYTPYSLQGGAWTAQDRQDYLDTLLRDVDRYAPGFSRSVVGVDLLTPRDLEQVFGLTGGNIFHGAMGLDQLYLARPLAACSDGRGPPRGLYLCGSGAHPGGGVMGAPGRLAAQAVLADRKR